MILIKWNCCMYAYIFLFIYPLFQSLMRKLFWWMHRNGIAPTFSPSLTVPLNEIEIRVGLGKEDKHTEGVSVVWALAGIHPWILTQPSYTGTLAAYINATKKRARSHHNGLREKGWLRKHLIYIYIYRYSILYFSFCLRPAALELSSFERCVCTGPERGRHTWNKIIIHICKYPGQKIFKIAGIIYISRERDLISRSAHLLVSATASTFLPPPRSSYARRENIYNICTYIVRTSKNRTQRGKISPFLFFFPPLQLQPFPDPSSSPSSP